MSHIKTLVVVNALLIAASANLFGAAVPRVWQTLHFSQSTLPIMLFGLPDASTLVLSKRVTGNSVTISVTALDPEGHAIAQSDGNVDVVLTSGEDARRFQPVAIAASPVGDFFVLGNVTNPWPQMGALRILRFALPTGADKKWGTHGDGTFEIGDPSLDFRGMGLSANPDGTLLVLSSLPDGTIYSHLLTAEGSSSTRRRVKQSSGLVQSTSTVADGTHVLVAGIASTADLSNIFVLRFSSDGTLDEAFGSHGSVTIHVQGVENSTVSASWISPERKLYVAGQVASLQTRLRRPFVLSIDAATGEANQYALLWREEQDIESLPLAIVPAPDGGLFLPTLFIRNHVYFATQLLQVLTGFSGISAGVRIAGIPNFPGYLTASGDKITVANVDVNAGQTPHIADISQYTITDSGGSEPVNVGTQAAIAADAVFCDMADVDFASLEKTFAYSDGRTAYRIFPQGTFKFVRHQGDENVDVALETRAVTQGFESFADKLVKETIESKTNELASCNLRPSAVNISHFANEPGNLAKVSIEIWACTIFTSYCPTIAEPLRTCDKTISNRVGGVDFIVETHLEVTVDADGHVKIAPKISATGGPNAQLRALLNTVGVGRDKVDHTIKEILDSVSDGVPVEPIDTGTISLPPYPKFTMQRLGFEKTSGLHDLSRVPGDASPRDLFALVEHFNAVSKPNTACALSNEIRNRR